MVTNSKRKNSFTTFLYFFAVTLNFTIIKTTSVSAFSTILHIHLGGSVVRALDSWPRGCRFDSRPVLYQVTTLGKTFTPTCLCQCKWLVSTHNFQVTVRLSSRVICKQSWARCSSQLSLLPSAGGKWIVAYGLQGEGLVCLMGMVVSADCSVSSIILRWRMQWMAA